MQDLKRIESAAGHVFAAIRREFGRIFLTFVGGLAVGAAAVEGGGAYFSQFGHTLTNVAAGIFGVVLGYAAALTVAIVETVRALIRLIRESTTEVEKVEKAVVGDVGKLGGEAGKLGGDVEGKLGSIVKAVEGDLGKK